MGKSITDNQKNYYNKIPIDIKEKYIFKVFKKAFTFYKTKINIIHFNKKKM